MDDLTLGAPDDFHVHLRQGPALAACVARHAERFARVLPMPNTVPPLSTPALLRDYLDAIRRLAPGLSVVPAFKILPGMGAPEVHALAEAGARVGKYYPAGSTTNAADGVRDPREVDAALAAMEERGLVLSVHAEDPGAPVLEREAAFLPVLDRIVGERPGLRMVVEHVSSAEGVRWVESAPPTVAATITAHHLAFTLDDLLGEALDPAFFCKPILKTPSDRAALRAAAVAASPRFFFGSDSAPHPQERKAAGAAGCYSAPVSLELLAGVFEEEGALDRLEAFVSVSGAAFYGLPRNGGTIGLRREAWKVPDLVDGFRPLAAGRTLRWRLGSGIPALREA